MAAIRAGAKVCLILAMHQKGTVIEIFERQHKSMMVDGPLSKTMWAKVRMHSADPNGPVIECRLGELMLDE
jgi:hypothetical protein